MGTEKKHGGQRVGSGRKPLEKRLTKERVLAAAEEIDELQPLSVKTLKKALGATKLTPQGDKVPDHAVRIKAAGILLNKRIPDLSRQELTGKDGEKVELGIIYFPAKKPVGT